MSKHSFRVYIDEAGDEGFVFKEDGSGSSRWLVLSAAIVRTKNDKAMLRIVDSTRTLLKRKTRQPLHFRDLRHEQRVPYVKNIAAEPVRTVSIVIHKPSIADPERFQSEKFLLYRYATRFLLERVSWLCRDHRTDDEGNGSAEVIFSNRSCMSYKTLKEYLTLLQTKGDPLDVRIDWSVIDIESIRAVNHEQLAGLQVADAVASSFYYAVTLNIYGECEEKYARLLMPAVYRHKGSKLGYGVKFWPDDFQKLKTANPQIAWFAE